MNKFKVGDKVTLKENFWEMKSDMFTYSGMRKLAGRTLEVASLYGNGNVRTKQDDSKDDTVWTWNKNWVELYTEPSTEITWDTLKWKDVVVDVNGIERMVLGVLNDLLFISQYTDFENHSMIITKKELQGFGYTIKQSTPEKLELTLDQIAEKFGVDVTNIKIKK